MMEILEAFQLCDIIQQKADLSLPSFSLLPSTRLREITITSVSVPTVFIQTCCSLMELSPAVADPRAINTVSER